MKKILNEIWKNKLALLSVVTILMLLYMFMVLLKSNFFSNYTTADYINFFAPILSLFSIIILVFTLRKSQKFNKNQLAMNEYNILLHDFELIKKQLEILTFDIKMENLPNYYKKILKNLMV